jgi:putative flippase GtrA
MHDRAAPRPRITGLLRKFTSVALLGFVISAVVLHFGMEAGLRPWSARILALLVAMHVTFLVNGFFVFRAITRERFFGQWAAYVTNSAVGNLCNYGVFVGLEASHWPVIGHPYVALAAGSVTAWAINFTGARLIVFGDAHRPLIERWKRRLSPRPRPDVLAPAAPAPSRRSPPAS